MSSFGPIERKEFGQTVRLAMACIEGSIKPVRTKAIPDDEEAIWQRLKVISQDRTSALADMLELLVRFDDLEGWKNRGASHCAAWMNMEMGISPQLGWEYLRVGRKLRSLPTTRALFRAGKLSWSKVRVIVNVATAENEKLLCHAALDAPFTDVKRICEEFRWNEDSKDDEDNENARALKQWESRTLKWDETSIGSLRIQLVLPPELAQAFLNSVENSLQKIDDPEASISQRRADAAILMAETSLQAAGKDIASADRYQVIVSVDASDLPAAATDSGTGLTPDSCSDSCPDSSPESSPKSCSDSCSGAAIPKKKPTLKGAGAIARETARRIACDCSITTNRHKNGEPTDIGRKSRIWPSAMARAIKERDQHCQFNGCTRTHDLQIHHIVHWADGGTTCIENGVSLCQGCHTLVHEGGYFIQRVDTHGERIKEQFEQQTRADDPSMFAFEKELRDDRDSFNNVRNLSPTRYRFRVLDPEGRDIRAGVTGNCASRAGQNANGEHGANVGHGANAEQNANAEQGANAGQNANAGHGAYSQQSDDISQDESTSTHSTRVECAEPVATYHRWAYCDSSASSAGIKVNHEVSNTRSRARRTRAQTARAQTARAQTARAQGSSSSSIHLSVHTL